LIVRESKNMSYRFANTLRTTMAVFVGCFCSLLFCGCGDSEKEDIFGRLREDGHIESAIMEQFFPEKYRSLPPLRVKKRGEAYNVWLELEDWQKGEKPWLHADMTDTRADAAHAMADFKVTDSHVQFGKGYKVRALKVIWPDEHAEDMRQGRFGTLHIERIDTAWELGPGPDEARLRAVLGLRNIGEDSKKLSGEFYLTGDDTVLISKLSSSAPSAPEKTKEAPQSGFVSAESFFISELSADSTVALELITDTVKTDVLRKFGTLRVEHLAYGWRRDIAHPQKQ
jgi:hypothetical protein